MISAALPKDEQKRLEALYNYDVLDTGPEAVFDELTELASQICGTPISLISLVDPDRQWFKSRFGLDATETSREIAFCSHAILGEGIFEVQNALEDERFSDNPLVISDPNIRFYAGTPLTTPGGHNIGTLCVIDDKPKALTEHQRKALTLIGKQAIAQFELRIQNKKLAISNQQKMDYLSNISHELRTPLNAIVGLSDLALQYIDENRKEELTHYLKQINFSGHRLLGAVNSILDIGQIEAGRMELKCDYLLVDEVINNITTMLQQTAMDKGVTLKTKVANEIKASRIWLDEQKISQVLINLIGNAIKFTNPGKSISVECLQVQNSLVIEVRDQGVGIDKQDLDKLFNKYSQVGKNKSEQKGTGLGLAISKGLLQVMGGTIKIESTLGEGTTARISLPIVNSTSDLDSIKRTKQIATNLSLSKVLVVEDNAINQMVVETMLKKMGLEVTVCESAELGLAQIEQQDFDLILMDINLPGMSGIEATRCIRKDNEKIPVIALTADIFRSNREKSLFTSFLTKPITVEQLQEEMAKLLTPR